VGVIPEQGQIIKFTDIDETKLLNTKVQCIPGAHLAELKETVRTLSNDKPCDRLVIVGGGNDCSDNTDTTALVNSFKDLIETVQSKHRPCG
jgi:hypothetical protein